MKDTPTELTLVEKNDLQCQEQRIERGKSNFLEVADALVVIRDRKLYREEYGTFVEYCRERWGFAKTYAYDLIKGAAAVNTLPPNLSAMADTERVAREAARVEPQHREAVVEEASKQAEAKGRSLTAKDVANAAAPKMVHKGGPVISSIGLMIARGVIEELKRILPNDTERPAGLRLVLNWCVDQLKEGPQ